MKKFRVAIKANEMFPFYMQHRMDDTKLDEWEKKRGHIIERDDVAHEDTVRAEFHSYRNGNGYYIPSAHVMGALINAGKYIKGKVGNSTKTMTNIVAAMFFVRSTEKNPEELPLAPQEYQIDKRSAVNKNVKARVISVRPKWEGWATEFELWIDNNTITQQTVKQIVEYAGNYVGIGSYRPEHKGPFGRFTIEKFEEIR